MMGLEPVLADEAAFEQACMRLAARLSPLRYTHSLGVAQQAAALAERYGADVWRARWAGLLHDVAREWSAAELVAAARDLGIGVDYLVEMAPMACLHAEVGADCAKREFGVEDEGVLAAIAAHTVGREQMSLLEKVVFLADAIEPNRPSAPYIEELRELAGKDLDKACLRAYDHTLDYLLRTRQMIHPVAVRGRNWLIYEQRLAARAKEQRGEAQA
jgi:predicted HD superfamily hydrolase involved in NAD metabolism